MSQSEVAVIVGAGEGLSAAVARQLAEQGAQVVLAARDVGKLSALLASTGARAVACDASKPEQVEALFADVDAREGPADLVVFNASRRVPGPLVDIDPDDVSAALMVSAFGGFLVGQAAARRMLARGSGSILFTGASASVKGYARSRRPSRWASSGCAAWPRAWPGSWRPRTFTWPISSSTAA